MKLLQFKGQIERLCYFRGPNWYFEPLWKTKWNILRVLEKRWSIGEWWMRKWQLQKYLLCVFHFASTRELITLVVTTWLGSRKVQSSLWGHYPTLIHFKVPLYIEFILYINLVFNNFEHDPRRCKFSYFGMLPNIYLLSSLLIHKICSLWFLIKPLSLQ